MARYRITDPNTGRTMVVSGDTPPTEADIDEIFASQPQENQPQQSSQNPLMDFLKNAVNKTNYALGFDVNDQGKVIGYNQERGENFAMGFVGGGGVASRIPNVKSLMQYLTKAGLGRKIEQVAQKATSAGSKDKFSDVATEIRQAVRQKFLPTKAVGKAEKEIISNLAPPNLSDVVTPTDLIRGRQAITQTYGGGPQGFQKLLMQATPEQKVGNVARSVLSKRAKDITPGLKPLDWLYSRVYSNPFLGDVPQIALKTAGILGLKQTAPQIFNSIFRGGK